MARVDDYKMSYDLAAKELAGRDFEEVAKLAGAEVGENGSWCQIKYYGRPVRISCSSYGVTAMDDGPDIPIEEQALILHYLQNADGRDPSGEWVTFREVPSGEFYWSSFVSRAKNPLVGFFGERPQLLMELAPLVGGTPAEGMAGDTVVVIHAFPKVPLLLQLWAGDDEFPADGNVLMDRTISGYLATEDVALVSGLPIYKMMAIARNR